MVCHGFLRDSPGRNHDYVDDAYYTYSDGDIRDDGIVGISFGALPSSYGRIVSPKISFNSPATTKMDASLPIFNDGSSDKDYDVKTHNSYGQSLRVCNSIHHVL